MLYQALSHSINYEVLWPFTHTHEHITDKMRMLHCIAVTKNARLMDWRNVAQHAAELAWERIALGTQWGTDRDDITPCKTLKHTYYEEAGGCEMWKLHQMDTTENHHTSYSVPVGHPLISCVCFSSLVARRGKEHNKNSCISWVIKQMQKIQCICTCIVLSLQSEFLEALRVELFYQMSWHLCHMLYHSTRLHKTAVLMLFCFLLFQE